MSISFLFVYRAIWIRTPQHGHENPKKGQKFNSPKKKPLARRSMFGLLHSSAEHVEVSSRMPAYSLNAVSTDVAPFCSQAFPFHPRVHTAPPRIGSTSPQNVESLKNGLLSSFGSSRVGLLRGGVHGLQTAKLQKKMVSAFIFRPRIGFTYLPTSRPGSWPRKRQNSPKKLRSSSLLNPENGKTLQKKICFQFGTLSASAAVSINILVRTFSE